MLRIQNVCAFNLKGLLWTDKMLELHKVIDSVMFRLQKLKNGQNDFRICSKKLKSNSNGRLHIGHPQKTKVCKSAKPANTEYCFLARF